MLSLSNNIDFNFISFFQMDDFKGALKFIFLFYILYFTYFNFNTSYDLFKITGEINDFLKSFIQIPNGDVVIFALISISIILLSFYLSVLLSVYDDSKKIIASKSSSIATSLSIFGSLCVACSGFFAYTLGGALLYLGIALPSNFSLYILIFANLLLMHSIWRILRTRVLKSC